MFDSNKIFVRACELESIPSILSLRDSIGKDIDINYNYNLPLYTSVSKVVDYSLQNNSDKMIKNIKVVKLLVQLGAQIAPSCFIKACTGTSTELINFLYSKLSIKCRYIYEQAFMEACKSNHESFEIISHLHSIFPKYSIEPTYMFICLDNLLKIKKYTSFSKLLNILVSDYGLLVLESYMIERESRINKILIDSVTNDESRLVIKRIFNFFETISERIFTRYFEFAMYKNIFWFVKWLTKHNKINNISDYFVDYFSNIPISNFETIKIFYDNLEVNNKQRLLIDYIYVNYDFVINITDTRTLKTLDFILESVNLKQNFFSIYNIIKVLERYNCVDNFFLSPTLCKLKKVIFNYFYENCSLLQFQRYCSILFPLTYKKKYNKGKQTLNDLVFFKYTGNPYHSIGKKRIEKNYEKLFEAKNDLKTLVIE